MALPARDSELVQIMDAALAEAARRAGDWLACRPGCTQCCHGAFAINQLDVLRLRAGMEELRVSDPAKAAAVESHAERWIAEFSPDFPGDAETGRIGESDEDRARFEEFANDAACPALDPATGMCDVYAYRPMTCRVFGPPVRAAADDGEEGLAHCELCFIGAAPDEVAACEMPVPHDLEAELLSKLSGPLEDQPGDQSGDVSGSSSETVVAYALLSPARADQ